MGKIIESACEFAVRIANDDSHGYDQINRWLPNVDCSSLVCLCYENAGVPVKSKGGATYTGNLLAGFTKCGFEAIKFKSSITLVRGDVLFYNYVKNGKTYGHAIIYLGDGKIVQASINENGTITGGKTGDQTGKEVAVSNYYVPSRGWDYILRYPDEETKQEVNTVDITMPVIQLGAKCTEVGTLQALLNSLGFTGKNGRALNTDHDFGQNTDYAVRLFQKSVDLTPDGIVGAKTWDRLFRSNY